MTSKFLDGNETRLPSENKWQIKVTANSHATFKIYTINFVQQWDTDFVICNFVY